MSDPTRITPTGPAEAAGPASTGASASPGGVSVATVPARLGSVEQRGIEPVPPAERTGRPMQLFWAWFAANISILGLPLGISLINGGLNLWQALIAAAVGAFGSFAIVGVISIAGRRGHAPSLTLSRAIFGVRGNIGPTVVSLLSRLGWETVNTATAAFALIALSSLLFGTSGKAKDVPVIALVSIGIFVVCTVIVSGLGHATLMVIQKWATWVFGGLNIVVAIFLLTRIDWSVVFNTPAGSTAAVIIGIGTIAGGTGIGWANAGADMSRYQGDRVSAGSLIVSAAAGAGIPLVLLIGLGSVLGAGEAGLAAAANGPVGALAEAMPPWLAIVYLVTAFGGLLVSNHMSVYSAGLTTLTLGVRIKRVYAVIVDVIVTTIGAIYFLLIADNFYDPFISFIVLLAVPITAWVGVFIADMLRRRDYGGDALLELSSRSVYWYRGGIEWRATGVWAAAIIIGYLFTQAGPAAAPWFTGPLHSTWFGQNGLGWAITLAVAFLGYLALSGARTPRATPVNEVRA
ncbi:cytosine permease [Leucobacter sp. wl10]|uniref:purine-cytosine permease family protein n=1 Tax=Leucobacter sp. wl10 TaxID=2304677 RepID=UPI000E5C112D|nr:cytosine permease [Leucobacter sp. wl10]RGE17616.1 cytosine permease [Leucobacter sp. wl10]